jgi:hypothetical protein
VFGLLIVICAASVALAVLQNAQSLALLASLGGYLAPVLLSTGGGNHVALFSYYAVLSVGILAISIWKAWRPLNLIGFAFSFGIGAMWGAENYQPSHYASAQFFLALNLVIYGVLAVLMALRHADSTQGALVDGTLAFGAPLVGFGLQVGLTQHWEYGPAFSALGFGALYLPLAWFTMKRWPERGPSHDALVPRAGRGLRHTRDSARAVGALDVDGLGARRRRRSVGRPHSAQQAHDLERHRCCSVLQRHPRGTPYSTASTRQPS